MTYLTGSFISLGHSTWPEAEFSNWPFGFQCMYSDASGARSTIVFRFLSTFGISDVTRRGVYLIKKKHFLTCPGKVKMWPNAVKLGMVRVRASQTFHSSLLRSLIVIRGMWDRNRIHPPRHSRPPSKGGIRWWNSRCDQGLRSLICVPFSARWMNGRSRGPRESRQGRIMVQSTENNFRHRQSDLLLLLSSRLQI